MQGLVVQVNCQVIPVMIWMWNILTGPAGALFWKILETLGGRSWLEEVAYKCGGLEERLILRSFLSFSSCFLSLTRWTSHYMFSGMLSNLPTGSDSGLSPRWPQPKPVFLLKLLFSHLYHNNEKLIDTYVRVCSQVRHHLCLETFYRTVANDNILLFKNYSVFNVLPSPLLTRKRLLRSQQSKWIHRWSII